jgi:crotonobetainyl-CoA:carnitine CoA-transferase CaiB-like acyl-CoA transferase
MASPSGVFSGEAASIGENPEEDQTEALAPAPVAAAPVAAPAEAATDPAPCYSLQVDSKISWMMYT